MNIRIIKRSDMPKRQEIIIRIAAVLMSIVFAGLILVIFGLNPLKIFATIIKGSLGTEIRIQQTIIRAIPLTITALGIIVAFKMKFWNIGAEGQITMGAFGATWVALNLPETLPMPVMLLLMMIAAMLCGGIWAFIPAMFKAKMGTNETIFTLMMNYIAIKFVTYLQYGPWMDPNAGGFPKIAKFPANAVLPSVFGVNIGWIIMLLFVVFVHIFMNYTKKGYEIAVVGESNNTARYAGINVGRVFRRTMFLSGALCGLVGMLQFAGSDFTITEGTAGGVGFTAITVAWLAKMNPAGMLVVSVFIAMLERGANAIQTQFKIPP